ncbi:hypothetical protein UlMin_037853 [Ulmus minor]
MSSHFLTKIIIYLILVFLVWEQLGPDEVKSQTAAKLLAEQEVSSLRTIARKLMSEEISDEFNPTLCIKKKESKPASAPYECSDKRTSVPCANTTINASSYITNINCSCLSHTCHVTELDWSSKGLKGDIPEEFYYLTHLERLDLSSNNLTGSIPDIWGNMSSLYMLDLSENKLTGETPKSLGNMKPKSGTCIRLQLDLSFNQLEGPIPATFGDLEKNLNAEQSLNTSSSCDISSFQIDLSFNYLDGSIPENLGNLKFLSDLILDSNLLNGTIPKSLSKITYLRRLSVSNNQLWGPIPKELGQLEVLEELWLDSNNFNGQLPTTFSQLKNLQYLRITDLANSSFQFPKSLNWADSKLEILILRNCSINGSIPENIGLIPNLDYLDLSFNKLTGLIPSSLRKVSIYLSLAENKLEGTIPEWIPDAAKKSDYGMDLSFNNFSDSSFKFDSNNRKLNLFSCCRSCNSAICTAAMKDENEYSEEVCPKSKPKNKGLYIHCGGEEVKKDDGRIYESDNDSSPVYTSPHGNWVRISSGEQSTVKEIKCGISLPDATLYNKARLASVSLKYYGLCLEDGEYDVKLHFAEIVFANNTDEADYTDNDSTYQRYQSSNKRIFNIYVQNRSERTDFNIKETAGKDKMGHTIVNVTNVKVENSVLKIHLYWAGKGSYWYNQGPLISAISVVPADINRRNRTLQVALISGASVVVFILLLLFIIAWAMGWLRKEEIIEIGVGPNKIVTLRQLMDATRGFSREMEIGRGGLGIVYKAELPDKQMVAVKKLSTLSSEGIDKLKSESYALKMLSHENLLQLFDLFIGKDFNLLIYEYMENKSLAKVLFDTMCNIRLSWEVRFNICLGIAKGLQYLHEHPRLKMVHRGIKAANILLDSDLKPKISEFGLAIVYAEDGDQETGQLKIIKSEASHGYMAPEYPLYGMMTTKYDVYGYGVVVLELVSGKKNAGPKYNQELEYLVDEVCLADSEGRLLDLVDKNLGESYDQKQAITLLKLAVKCTHISHILRPTMSQIMSVLTGEKTLDMFDKEIANTSSATTKKEDFAESSISSHV